MHIFVACLHVFFLNVLATYKYATKPVWQFVVLAQIVLAISRTPVQKMVCKQWTVHAFSIKVLVQNCIKTVSLLFRGQEFASFDRQKIDLCRLSPYNMPFLKWRQTRKKETYTCNLIGSTFFASQSNFIKHHESALDVIIRKVYYKVTLRRYFKKITLTYHYTWILKRSGRVA